LDAGAARFCCWPHNALQKAGLLAFIERFWYSCDAQPHQKVRIAPSLQPSTLFENVELEVRLTSNDEVDSEVLGRLQKAYEQNRE
jgi:hypothetical protein